jgi:HAD superfamily hydrolase (TIGR01549 family)
MKILFYINPLVVRSDPSFYSGAIHKKIIPQAKLLLASGHEITFIVSEFDATHVINFIPQANVISISQRELVCALGSTRNIERALYKSTNQKTIASMYTLIKTKAPSLIDVVIAWETPANLFRQLYSNAKIIHQMPGFLSRVPFPELYTLDMNGLFHESMLSKHIDTIRTLPVDPRAITLLQSIRAELLSFISANTPITRGQLDPLGKFKRLILLPLQVTDQYAFLADSGYESQLALLMDVLASTPEYIGVVVTQYANASASEKVLNDERYLQLKAVYPHLIFDKSFDRIDSISQYLLSAVDAVISVSSSIGTQALLWQKPFIALEKSHMVGLATHASIADYASAIAEGGDPSVDADNVLSWILTYQQPLASIVLQDGHFLDHWLQALPQVEDPSVLPNFFDLDPNYAAEFIFRSKRDRASEMLVGIFKERGNTLLEQNFRKKIQDGKPQLISFDIFDTLVDRIVEQPVHVFRMIESEVDFITKGCISNFQVARQSIERSLREKIGQTTVRQEITLEEIYDEMMERYALTLEKRNAIRDLEIAEELRVLRRREAGWRLYQLAKSSGIRVILISDMYLPEYVIRQILNNAGYPADLPLYLSSTIGLRKHEGDLFAHVESLEGIKYTDWLHIGDNPHGDVAAPKKFGITSHLIPSAYKLLGSNGKLNVMLQADRKTRSKAEAAIYGLIQRRYFDDPHRTYPSNTHFGGDPFIMGYIGMGPIFYGFLHWVMTQAKRDGTQRLLFLSRDGKVLWRMAEVLFPESEGWPAISYAMSSRRAARVASMFNPGDISKLIDSSLSATTLEDFFIKKLGIELKDVDDELIRNFGFSDRHAKITVAHRETLRHMAMALAERILCNAATEREFLVNHYRDLGVVPGARVGIVDIGYAGTMQAAMERITGEKNIAGYYYITFESALDLAHRTGVMRGYAGDFVKPKIHQDAICKNGFLFETLFCSSDASFICFRETPEGNIEPRFDVAFNDGVRRHIVEKAHDAAVTLARELRLAYGNRITDLSLNVSTASRIITDFIISPSGRDAEIFEGCLFDDSFAGSKPRYIVPNRKIIAKNKDIINSAIWREGAAVFSRRPDLFPSEASTIKPLLKEEKKYGQTTKEIIQARQDKINQSQPIKSYKLRKYISEFERKIFEQFIKSERKLEKYSRNRSAFFIDSKSKAIQFYWRFVGHHLITKSNVTYGLSSSDLHHARDN